MQRVLGLVPGAVVEVRGGVGGHPAFGISGGSRLAVERGRRRGPRAVRALGAFLRGDFLRVGMVVEVEPFDGVEVEDGCVDFIEVFDRVVEVFLRFE